MTKSTRSSTKTEKIDQSYLQQFMQSININPEYLTERNLKTLNEKSKELRNSSDPRKHSSTK